jgi:SPX domain protein involved in polyphosphate accumulation
MTAMREAHLPRRLNGPSIMRSHPLRQKQRQSKLYLSFRRSEQQNRRRLNLPKVVRLIRKKIELKIKFKPVIKSPCRSVLKFTPIILRLFTPYLFLRSSLPQFLKSVYKHPGSDGISISEKRKGLGKRRRRRTSRISRG